MISFNNILVSVLIPAVEHSLIYGVLSGFCAFFWLAFSKKEKEFLTYSARHYVKVKNDYLSIK